MKRRSMLIVALLGLVGSTLLVQLSIAEDKGSPQTLERMMTVRVSPVEAAQSYTQSRSYTGTIESTRTAELSFLRSGRLQEVLVDEGSTVSKGQLLAVLDTRSLRAERGQRVAQLDRLRARHRELVRGPRREPKLGAQSQVRRLESELRLAESKLARRENLFRQGAIPAEDLDEWESQVRVTRENLELAKQNSLELDNGTRPEVLQQSSADIRAAEASLQALDVQFEDSELRAPFAGRIALRSKDEGVILRAGESVLSLDEAGKKEVLFDLPTELDIPNVAELEVDGQKVEGRLLNQPSRRDQRSGTHRVRYSVPNGHPGASAILDLELEIAESGVWVPMESLRAAGNGLWQCYALSPDKIVLSQRVELIHREGERALVRGTLGENSSVIVGGANAVVPGQRVAVAK